MEEYIESDSLRKPIEISLRKNGRHSITSIENLNIKGADIKKILKYFKKKLACSGLIFEGCIDLSRNVVEILIKEFGQKKQEIKVHGY